MSIQPQPIYGNQYFTEVQNVASTNIQRLHADQVVTSHLQVGVDTKLAGDLKEVTVKVRKPASALTTTGAYNVLKWNANPDGTYSVFTLPANAAIKNVFVNVQTLFTSGGAATLGFGTGTVSSTTPLALASLAAVGNVCAVGCGIPQAGNATLTAIVAGATLAAGVLGDALYVTYQVPV